MEGNSRKRIRNRGKSKGEKWNLETKRRYGSWRREKNKITNRGNRLDAMESVKVFEKWKWKERQVETGEQLFKSPLFLFYDTQYCPIYNNNSKNK